MLPLVYALAGALLAQNDPAYGPLAKAYDLLRDKDYEAAIVFFKQAVTLAPARVAIRKDLAYTLLKIGEQEAARDQFGEAVQLDPTDYHVALEYAFLCFETRQQREARRVFDRIRKSGDAASRATAEQAFQNVDRPLAEGIARWQQALERQPGTASVHEEIAKLAEQRDDPALAATHYERAWKINPEGRYLLLDLGRVWKEMNESEKSVAALLAASRGAQPRVAEAARGLLPSRYPYVYEFRRALELDPRNVDLRRELAYLLLNMNQKQEAETELRQINEQSPDDFEASAQLGLLLLARQDGAGARPYLDKALASGDDDLVARVRAAIGMPPALRRRPAPIIQGTARQLADKSYDAGFMKDALRYYNAAHEADPTDFAVMLKLGWTHNMLHQDDQAVRWFSLATRSPDAKVAAEAARAQKNLAPQFARIRTSAWLLPMYSSRWKDVFTYGQVRVEARLGRLPFRPYASVRFAGDARGSTGSFQLQYLSESAFIIGAGMATRSWHGATAWGEAGSAISYLGKRRDVSSRAVPDYRGGLSFGRARGRLLGAESSGAFAETHEDGLFVSRFQNTFLLYSQNRFGYTFAGLGSFRMQLCWNANVTADAKRLYWANYAETGPGIRFRWDSLPPSVFFAVDVLRGAHTINAGNPRRPNYYDLRIGIWYAFSR